ncbi:PadR family transcriptional regulator [Subtercola sp. YIM 133946]|uniref:PadR family transcriptional regulator n=1 Tax=Subtercola sp. YIM 133946 TaxID=3118909 RepID=UPI002F9352AA
MSGIFGHGDLRLYLLSLLAEHPRHGYELIQELSERFGGTYSPSAGTIYPRLAKLEDEGLVTKSTDGRKTVYSITDAGRAELDARQDDLDSIENNVTDSLRVLADGLRAGVNDAMRSLRADLAAASRDSRPDPNRTYSDDAASAGSWPSGFWGTRVPASEQGAPSTGAPGAAETPDAPEQTQAEDRRQANNDAVRDVEAALNAFRSSVRVDLRKYAARSAVPQAAVAHLTSELARLQAEFKASLRA